MLRNACHLLVTHLRVGYVPVLLLVDMIVFAVSAVDTLRYARAGRHWWPAVTAVGEVIDGPAVWNASLTFLFFSLLLPILLAALRVRPAPGLRLEGFLFSASRPVVVIHILLCFVITYGIGVAA